MGKAAPTAPPPPQVPEETISQPSTAHAEAKLVTGEPDKNIAVAEEQEHGTNLVAEMEQVTLVEGETPVISGVDVVEGATTVVFEEVRKGETPVVGELEEATPGISDDCVGEETTERISGGDALISEKMVAEEKTPVYIEGATPILSVEGEALITDDGSEPKESGLELEIEDLAVPAGEEFHVLGTECELEKETLGSDGEADEEEERRLAAEQKRKGKQAAASRVKKAKTTAGSKSEEVSLPTPTKVPFAKEPAGPPSSSESDEDEIEVPEEILNLSQKKSG
ncbi:uncharacterized protein LOC121760764 [Salvia splendens]|uniref:uncharacterized protein LOC121760764 n=1 Tax=Salvia splendens TaxID=180675 RepID=UPI001C271039|nr:uncharacterized protein LOC121760764 [Salvia splendens]